MSKSLSRSQVMGVLNSSGSLRVHRYSYRHYSLRAKVRRMIKEGYPLVFSHVEHKSLVFKKIEAPS